MEAAREYQVTDEDLAQVEEMGGKKTEITSEIKKVIVGQDKVIEEILIALFCRGHCLLVGVPGLAKTLLISTLAGIMELQFNRVQFTSDLMPSDITGTDILEEEVGTKRRSFRFLKGPIFTNILLADEINRTPPKTQAALLEAMQEHHVTAAGQTYTLQEPFFVLATQNPIEQEGTYPLPEAQLDRFMFDLWLDYPSFAEEVAIVKSTTSPYNPDLKRILSAKEIIEFQDLVRRVPVADNVIEYAVTLVDKTRPTVASAPPFIKNWIRWGAGPRASQYLILGAKTRAILSGRHTPDIQDIKALAPPVLRHRIVTSFNAEAEGVSAIQIIERLVEESRS